MQENKKIGPYLSLHLLILIFGFTGILGKYIETPASALTVYRTGITFISLGLYMWYKGFKFFPGWKNVILLLLSGGVIGLHWVLFFQAIKTANVSITMAMLSTGALFASFLEPIFYHRRLRMHEVIFGLLAVVGVYIIFADTQDNQGFQSGIIIALCAAFLSAGYSIINSKWSQKMPQDTVMVVFYEMLGSVVVVSIIFSGAEGFFQGFSHVSWTDALGILFLALVCTSYTNVRMIQLFKYISPFTMMLNINIEPVYSMIMAVVLFSDERMSGHFYIGAAVILATVVLNAVLNNYRDRRHARKIALAEQTKKLS